MSALDPTVVAEPVPTGSTSPGAGWVTWLGLAVVLTAAAVLSFAALRDLAVAVRIHRELAWLLPIAVDAGAAVSCAAWLSRAPARMPPASPAPTGRQRRWAGWPPSTRCRTTSSRS